MRYLVISDIHSNVQALSEVLKIKEKINVDKVICLGDIVGYNANPQECYEICKTFCDFNIMGNHDLLASLENIGYREERKWSKDALDGMYHTKASINEECIKWLKELHYADVIEDSGVAIHLTHGAPYTSIFDDGDFPYLMSSYEAKTNSDYCKENKVYLSLFGHTHIPTFVKQTNDYIESDFSIEGIKTNVFNIGGDGEIKFDLSEAFEKKAVFLINPGSVGQARGGGNVSFGILDTEEKTFEFCPFSYNYKKAVQAVRDIGYSKRIAERLEPTHDILNFKWS